MGADSRRRGPYQGSAPWGLDPRGGITNSRLWNVVRCFFRTAAGVIVGDHSVLAEKLRKASPHWMRHTHASYALARGAELTAARDNLRHASISTTSIHLYGDDIKRGRQIGAAFGTR